MSTTSTSYRTEVLPTDTITKFVNCLLPIDGELVHQDLYVNSTTGLIISPQELFFENRILPTRVVDLGGRVLSPGFIDVQLNGACGFDFSVIPQDEREYGVGYNMVNKGLIKTGVTSYLPTLTSQLVDVYQKALPWLAAPPKDLRDPSLGSESLGAHCEGPFLNPEKNGIHTPSVLRKPGSFKTIEDMYGSDNLSSAVKMVTLAPELLPLAHSQAILAELKSRGVIVSAGHTTSSYDQLVDSGINMTTHLFNAMPQPHQRSPGILGAVLADKKMTRYYGIIADGVHVHPANVNLAYKTNGEGCILVTDAMKLVGCADGVYEWTNGERIVKKGNVLILEGTDKIAGSSATLIYCLNNFIQWTSTPLAKALETVTSTPARLLGLEGKKGSLLPGADADFCVLDVQADGRVAVDEVWKFGVKVHEEKHRRRSANVVVESKL